MAALLTMIKEKREERKRVTDAAQALLTKAWNENKRSLTADEDKEFNTRHEEGDKLQKDIDRLQKQHDTEVGMSQAISDTRSAGRENVSGDGELVDMPDNYVELKRELQAIEFRRWLGKDVIEMPRPLLNRRSKIINEIGPYFRSEMQRLAGDESLDPRGQMSYRALSAVTGSLGQDTIPISFMYNLEVATKYFGGIINAADFVDTDDGRQLPWPTMTDVTNTGETITENTAVAGATGGGSEQDPTYGVVNLNAYMSDTGFVLVPIQLIQDSAFNVDEYLNEALDMRLGRRMNTLCTTGSGSNQATGFLTVTTLGATSTTGTGLVYNDLVNLFHSVDPSYRSRPKAGFMLNDSSILVIRKLVDNNGRPLWLAGGTTGDAVGAGASGTILDKPYWTNNDMPTVGINNKSIAFGDWSKYKIRRVKSIMMVQAKERFIDKLQVGFLAFLRFDGNLIDAGMHPIKHLLQAAS